MLTVAWFSGSDWSFLEDPKSQIFTVLIGYWLLSIRMLHNFMSLWVMPKECRSLRPLNTPSITWRIDSRQKNLAFSHWTVWGKIFKSFIVYGKKSVTICKYSFFSEVDLDPEDFLPLPHSPVSLSKRKYLSLTSMIFSQRLFSFISPRVVSSLYSYLRS